MKNMVHFLFYSSLKKEREIGTEREILFRPQEQEGTVYTDSSNPEMQRGAVPGHKPGSCTHAHTLTQVCAFRLGCHNKS